jgi:hypothetical protein
MLHASGKCGDIKLNKQLVLAEYSAKDRLINSLIFKAHNPMGIYKKLLNDETINDNEIDYTKDVTKDLEYNNELIGKLAKFNPQGTPSFFIQDENENIEQVLPPEPDIGQMLVDSMSKYI